MRFALSVASVLVLTSAAFAEEAKPAEAPPPPPAAAPAPAPTAGKKLTLRVVRVLADTQQALLFDKIRGTHVLVDVGTQVDGFKVSDIDEDTVTLSPIDGGSLVVLAGPDPSWRRHRDAKPAVAAPAPEDPYASAAPVDPYAEETVRTVQAPDAPITAGDGGVRTVQAPDAAAATPRVVSAAGVPTATAPTATAPTATAPTATAIVTPVAAPVAEPVAEPAGPTDTSSNAAWSTTPDPTASALASAITDAKPAKGKTTKATTKAEVKAEPKPVAEVAPAGDVITRADVNAALGNFGALASAVRGSFTADGAHLDAVAPDSLFAKAGLRAGDTITEINHQPMRSIDDAATLYSRSSVLRTVTIQLVRAGKPMTLQLSIR